MVSMMNVMASIMIVMVSMMSGQYDNSKEDF